MARSTTAYLLEKLERAKAEIQSDEHYEKTPTLTYGDHNPFDVKVIPCDRCGVYPKTTKSNLGKWMVTCPKCNKTIKEPQRGKWSARIDWIKINPGSISYRDIPLFGLKQLNPNEARERMVGIRRNLELRVSIGGLELELSHRLEHISPPGREYMFRMDAYLRWAICTQSLIKYAVINKVE